MNDYTATYSPEDNKLRLYSLGRLPEDIYRRVKAQGFIYAPKQELFVAPMWTPVREDLLLELCGEIGDEDKSLIERTEERAERFSEYSEHRAEDAQQAKAAVDSITDGIPLGQPILVGHHSEKRARKDAERIENGMRKAVQMWETSQYWKQRAASAIRHAKYKERPDVRARRIKKLEAEKRKQERAKTEAENLIQFWEGKSFAKNPITGERKPIEITQENQAFLCEILGRMPNCGVRIAGKDGENWFSAWDILRPAEERYENCPEKTVSELQGIALRLQRDLIVHYNRWIAHFDNRLIYEKAMLEEDGGTVSDRKGPEKGGACRCWASHRGGWSYIQKVNRVSVTVLDNWGNGGENFTRNIPFDKLVAIMTAAEVKAARESNRLTEYADKTGFALHDEPRQVPPTPKPKEPTEFDAMKETLKAGVQVVAAPNLFPTPADLVIRMIELADLTAGDRVLEPSAGTGNLVKGIRSAGIFREDCVAVEVNRHLSELLQAHTGKVHCADFLQCNGDLGKFDRVIMNPPFDHGEDIKHILHALTFLKEGGRLVALCANGPKQQEQLKPLCDSWDDLGCEEFEGTNVNVALIVINKP